MRTVAILPVKSFSRAKHRLGEAFSDRPALAAAMVADVLDALAAVPTLDGVIVVTAEPIAARIATERGVQVVHDPAERGRVGLATLGRVVHHLDPAFRRDARGDRLGGHDDHAVQ